LGVSFLKCRRETGRKANAQQTIDPKTVDAKLERSGYVDDQRVSWPRIEEKSKNNNSIVEEKTRSRVQKVHDRRGLKEDGSSRLQGGKAGWEEAP